MKIYRTSNTIPRATRSIGKSYLLRIEFADSRFHLDQSLHELQLAGLRPIVTGPKRNPLIRAQPRHLHKWLGQGCYAQDPPANRCGKIRRSAQEMAEQWLKRGSRPFIASDAHKNVTSRPLRLKETFDRVAAAYGEEVARALLVDNPLAVFEGRPLPYVPELPDDLVMNVSELQGQRRHNASGAF